MFYDERIEGIKGQIARKAIFISLMVSLVFGGMHVINILVGAPKTDCILLASVDIAVFVSALAALIIGYIRGRKSSGDERGENERNIYYNKVAKILLYLILGVYSFALPISTAVDTPINFSDYGVSDIVARLLFILGVYVTYSFKKNNIYYNYTIMENEHYYGSVFRNVGKLLIHALIFVAVSIVSCGFTVTFKNLDFASTLSAFVSPILYIAGVCVVLIVYYLLSSVLERISYKRERGLSRSPAILTGIAVIIFAVMGIVMLIGSRVYTDYEYMSIMGRSVIYTVYRMIIGPGTLTNIALIMALIYLCYELCEEKADKLISICGGGIIIAEITYYCFVEIDTYIQMIASNSDVFNYNLSSIIYGIPYSLWSLAATAFTWLILYAMSKRKYISVFHCIAPALFIGITWYISKTVNFPSTFTGLAYTLFAYVAEFAYFIAVIIIARRNILNMPEDGYGIPYDTESEITEEAEPVTADDTADAE